MNLTIGNIDENQAKEILGWKYEKPYDFYNNEINEEGIEELLDGSYKVLTDEKGEVFGFFCTGETARIPIGNQYGVYSINAIDMGLGMNPEYVGKGYGYDFCSLILHEIKEQNKGIPIRLSVAIFTKRAVHLYKNLGFVIQNQFRADTADFVTMIKED